MTTGTLYILSAPSGCGKTSLVEALLKECPELVLSVSYTTRTPRPREVSGIHYQFVTLAHFKKMITENGFLEYAKVFEHYYGTSRDWIQQKLQQGIHVILEIDWQGMQQIKKYYSSAVSVFIVPPSLLSLRKRLLGRNEDTIDTIEARLKQAKFEIEHFTEYDYLVVNHDFNQAVADLKAIFRAHCLRTVSQSSIAQSLLNE